MSSMWPSVSSPATPSPSHSTSLTPRKSRSARSRSALDRARIAVRVQQALLRRHHDAGAVDVDRSALEHQPGLEHRHPQQRREGARHRRVAHQRFVLAAPRVEAPRVVGQRGVRQRLAGLPPLGPGEQEVGAVVADPRVDGRDHVELHGAGLRPRHPRPHLIARRLVVDQDVDRLVLGEHLDHAQEDHLDLRHAIRPRQRILGPRQPGGGVRMPLGRHRVAERGGRRAGHRGAIAGRSRRREPRPP